MRKARDKAVQDDRECKCDVTQNIVQSDIPC